jgi:hypothetical protein
VIGPAWARFFQEVCSRKSPYKADRVGVYADYASDDNREYTHMLAARVTSDAQVPAGMVVKKIPAQKFAVVPSEKGPASCRNVDEDQLAAENRGWEALACTRRILKSTTCAPVTRRICKWMSTLGFSNAAEACANCQLCAAWSQGKLPVAAGSKPAAYRTVPPADPL